MDKEQLEALLGRPLSTVETTNLDMYLDIAEEALETLICTPIEDVSETRTFDIREGYSTAFIDIFWNVTEVKIDGNLIDADQYQVRQWDKRNASWYNSIVFNSKFHAHNKEIEVTADWGFEPSSDTTNIPLDLQSLIAGLFAQITKKNKFDGSVSSKQTEDFRISFNAGADLDDEFAKTYGSIINKYSLCNIPNVQHGRIRHGC